uniref:HDC05705 n=1 Tax=Drosophila melanogaster TaxID=7227 RepID=Q6IGQ1_DROME|nr:TPA_inf: HDC05705 [Drosophila melanogaster]
MSNGRLSVFLLLLLMLLLLLLLLLLLMLLHVGMDKTPTTTPTQMFQHLCTGSPLLGYPHYPAHPSASLN